MSGDDLLLLCVHDNRQLKDQLPGGKYYQPTADIMDETGICHTTNILSEHDFAQIDRKVNQKQYFNNWSKWSDYVHEQQN